MIAVLAWESLAPLRSLTASLRLRWFGNFSTYLINAALLRFLLPISATALAVAAAEWEVGLLNRLPSAGWIAFVASVLVLDLARYGVHLMFHRVPFLWRLHRMHHTDQDCDFTTGFRFHPLEALITSAMYFGTILAIGGPPMAVVASELLIAALVPISHANARLPRVLERGLRLVFVTPDMHRVHHSAVSREGNSNLGIVFSCWDRIFGTYVRRPSRGHEGMVIGISGCEGVEHLKLLRMLADPFVAAPGLDRTAESLEAARLKTSEPRH